MSTPSILLAPIAAIINTILQYHPNHNQRLINLSGKYLKVELTDLQIEIFIKITASNIELSTFTEAIPKATLSGTTLAFLKTAVSYAQSPKILFTGDIQIHGDVEFIQQLKQFVQESNLDWEEILSKYTGDILAYQISSNVRYVKSWGSNTVKALSQSLTEYLHEEIQLLPNHGEVIHFLDTVDHLRAQLNRLEARIQRLTHQL
ncbi:ubiquinone biosynthesis accessory factor UbiJ [Candidatus Nitrosacidococcus tergens]|uniref:Ubiquinone biosynthesis accessory factor UbiJ n=1 Tax=Candidatus Nitrosacidococcus tergens TaxID=553981 RepID=A0A7G1Q7U9_9GAMM|nr:SCP2 sterol-binding domain-containing protein [Candidatus Nitrosacidococcus tergens]CAB1274766.1 Sterol-binding domain protein [Candidatus Nitrosacidococcus tergens]